MKWKKLGRIIQSSDLSLAKSHATNPFAEQIDEHLFRVFVTPRNGGNQSVGAYVDVEFVTETEVKIIEAAKQPLLEPGKLGTFDESGAMLHSIVSCDNNKFLYYTGWSLPKTTPFIFFVGLAVITENGKYERYSEAPVLGRNKFDPYLTGAPCVIKDGGTWKMWYISGTGWSGNEKNAHFYRIHYAESPDGISWIPKAVAIDYENDEYAIARPTVRKVNGGYQMWFCSRGGQNAYRMHYAESADGISWERSDNFVGLDVSAEGWDSEMICYPSVFEYNGKEYMLYNGNGYGATGVGLAMREE